MLPEDSVTDVIPFPPLRLIYYINQKCCMIKLAYIISYTTLLYMIKRYKSVYFSLTGNELVWKILHLSIFFNDDGL